MKYYVIESGKIRVFSYYLLREEPKNVTNEGDVMDNTRMS